MSISYWKHLLKLLANNNGKLLLPLGKWLSFGSDPRHTWNNNFDYRYQFLYRQAGETMILVNRTVQQCWLLLGTSVCASHKRRTNSYK